MDAAGLRLVTFYRNQELLLALSFESYSGKRKVGRLIRRLECPWWLSPFSSTLTSYLFTSTRAFRSISPRIRTSIPYIELHNVEASVVDSARLGLLAQLLGRFDPSCLTTRAVYVAWKIWATKKSFNGRIEVTNTLGQWVSPRTTACCVLPASLLNGNLLSIATALGYMFPMVCT